MTNDAGNAMAINRYDEYGIPAATNMGRFQYTGQKWLPHVGLYDYKARMYSPTLGRFMQTDPIGYADGMNWYNYVGSDPVNKRDPWGLCQSDGTGCGPIIVTGERSGLITFTPLFFSEPVSVSLPPLARPERPQGPNNCEGGGKSGWATIADYADKVAKGSDAAALGTAAVGLVLAPTGAGGAALGITALGLKGVSLLANGISMVANYQAGNKGAALSSAIGMAAGAGVGSLAGRGLSAAMGRSRMFGNLTAGQMRGVDYGSGLAGSLTGDTAESLAKVGCLRILQ